MDEFKKVALEAVKKAEERILVYFHNLPKVQKKANMSPVTRADTEAEEIITESILKVFPQHGFVGEELGEHNLKAEFVWYIDPIDGTKEFIRGIEAFGTILGLKSQGEIILGIVDLPAMREVIFASKEEATTINGQRVRVSSVADLGDGYVNIGGYKDFANKSYITALTKIRKLSQSMKGFPYVDGYRRLIKGQTDAMLESHALPHDVSAWSIIVKQAGGRYSDFYGNTNALGPTSLATNGKLHDQLLDILKEVTV